MARSVRPHATIRRRSRILRGRHPLASVRAAAAGPRAARQRWRRRPSHSQPSALPVVGRVRRPGCCSGCSRPPELIGIDNPAVPVASVPDLSRHRIFIVTTREASEVVGAFYSAGRAPELGLASVEVSVPPNHVLGHLERPERLPPDPRTEFAVVDPVVYRSDAAFVSEIDRELASRPVGQRKLLALRPRLQQHHERRAAAAGAVRRMTPGFQGVPVLFTWASAARAPRYVYDLNSALVARVKLKDMADILVRTNAESVDVFAHSMGAFLTMEGLVDAEQSRRPRQPQDHQPHHAGLARHRHRSVPHPDRASCRSRSAAGCICSSPGTTARCACRGGSPGGVPRVGAADAAELEQLGVTVIDLSEIRDSNSGSHSKFAGSPEVVQLIGAGLNSRAASARAAPPGSTGCWRTCRSASSATEAAPGTRFRAMLSRRVGARFRGDARCKRAERRHGSMSSAG